MNAFIRGFADELSKIAQLGAGLGSTGIMASRATVPPGLPVRPGMGRPGMSARLGGTAGKAQGVASTRM